MGWASGSRLAEVVWAAVEQHLPTEKRQEVALGICDAFADEDCDTLQEAEDLFNTAYPWQVFAGGYVYGEFSTKEEAEALAANREGASVQNVWAEESAEAGQ